jgi:hypothetical protein
MRRIAWLGLLFLLSCAGVSSPIPATWAATLGAEPIGDYCAHFECAAKPQTPSVRIDDGRIVNGTKALTPKFAAIDSFDVSLDRREVVFSAKRKDSFDVGLVSLDGSDVHWIPEDRADEVDAQWAPRGNKVSYILRTATGSIVRTVHVPTATPLSVDFPETQIDALLWEPQAERFAVAIESPRASQSLVSMTYAGEKRKELVPPAARLDAELEPIGGVLVMRPSALRYNERLPLVVWIDPHPFAWSDARAQLMRNAQVAVAIAPAAGDAFWRDVRNVTWIDNAKTYVVNGVRDNAAISIVADPAIPSHRYIRRGKRVSVSPAVVQSFAAAFIADDLKGTAPPNGRR